MDPFVCFGTQPPSKSPGTFVPLNMLYPLVPNRLLTPCPMSLCLCVLSLSSSQLSIDARLIIFVPSSSHSSSSGSHIQQVPLSFPSFVFVPFLSPFGTCTKREREREDLPIEDGKELPPTHREQRLRGCSVNVL